MSGDHWFSWSITCASAEPMRRPPGNTTDNNPAVSSGRALIRFSTSDSSISRLQLRNLQKNAAVGGANVLEGLLANPSQLGRQGRRRQLARHRHGHGELALEA